MAVSLNEVFGIATEINNASYVNRGGLDELLGYYLGTQRHVAIHGDSKQGKTWEEDGTLLGPWKSRKAKNRKIRAARRPAPVW